MSGPPLLLKWSGIVEVQSQHLPSLLGTACASRAPAGLAERGEWDAPLLLRPCARRRLAEGGDRLDGPGRPLSRIGRRRILPKRLSLDFRVRASSSSRPSTNRPGAPGEGSTCGSIARGATPVATALLAGGEYELAGAGPAAAYSVIVRVYFGPAFSDSLDAGPGTTRARPSRTCRCPGRQEDPDRGPAARGTGSGAANRPTASTVRGAERFGVVVGASPARSCSRSAGSTRASSGETGSGFARSPLEVVTRGGIGSRRDP